MQQDSSRSHSVVVTRQGTREIPEDIRETAQNRGGQVYTLNLVRGNVLGRAQELRNLAAEFDFVVTHIYAEDVVPLIAFANRQGLPPIAFLDQADHAFSCGAAVRRHLRRTA